MELLIPCNDSRLGWTWRQPSGRRSTSFHRALAGPGDEGLLAVQGVLLSSVGIARVLTVGLHVPGFCLLLHIRAEDLVLQHANQALFLDRKEDLDPAVQVTWH